MSFTNRLNFKGDNPGAVQFGNFINYYQFHPPDERIKLLPPDICQSNLSTLQCLDLGCNSGDLTVSLYKHFKEKFQRCEILAIDLDPILINRATEQVQNEPITFKCLNIMEPSDRLAIKDYMKRKKIEKFDCVCCFSLTMWIHLNHGDNGLKGLLKYLSQICDVLVLEPQPWKCYKTAIKRMKLSNFEFPLFTELKIRQRVEDEIEEFVINGCSAKKIFESERTNWGRKLLVFKCT